VNHFAKQTKLLENPFLTKATVAMRFPAKKNAGCPKALRDFPPRKDGILHPPSGCLGTPLPLPQSLYGRTYADVTTKISRIDRLPNLLSNVPPLAGFARGLRYHIEDTVKRFWHYRQKQNETENFSDQMQVIHPLLLIDT